MYHDLSAAASFWLLLLAVDEDLAAETRKKGCSCGGRLHGANLRKPRGTPVQLPEHQHLRLSFCCDRDGYRKRVLPLSVLPGPKSLPVRHRRADRRHTAGAHAVPS